jgi:tetratricopeptide (TPR) repeat protein
MARHEFGDYFGAISDFTDAIRLDPRQARFYLNRAAARSAAGETSAATEDCKAALAINPEAAEVHGNLAALSHERKDYAAAIAEYSRAAELNPQLYWVYLQRGHAHYHKGRVEAALADYRQAFQLEPRLTAKHLCRRFVREVSRDPSTELASCQEHLERHPDDFLSSARRGLALLLLGRDAEAKADLSRFHKHCPHDVEYLQVVVERVWQRRLASSATDLLFAQPLWLPTAEGRAHVPATAADVVGQIAKCTLAT